MDAETIRYSYLSVLLATVILVIFSAIIYPWLLDDAYISFRYAENFVSGNGLVFNEGERVEGYTNFLWIMILALGRWIGFDIVWFARIVGFLFGIGCFILMATSFRIDPEIDRRISVPAVVFLATSPIFISWGISGMEVTLYSFLILLTALYYLKIRDAGTPAQFTLLGFISTLMVMTRPEGSIIVATIFFHFLVTNRGRRITFLMYMTVPFLIIYLPYFIWRYSYYGYFFPNTFYTKVGTHGYQLVRGIEYFAKFVIISFFMVMPFLYPPSLYSWVRRFRRIRVIAVMTGVYTIYVIVIGGDFMPALRFLAPIMPLLSLIFAAYVSTIKNRAVAVAVISLTIAYSAAQTGLNHHITDILWTDKVALHGKEVGLWLRENAAPDALLATNTAGSIPYYSKLRTIDMLGLTDEHIAHRNMPSLGSGPPGHEKGDAAYVLSRRPDYIHLGTSYGSELPHFFSGVELYDNPEFHRQYELREFPMPSGNTLLLYVRRDLPVSEKNVSRTAGSGPGIH